MKISINEESWYWIAIGENFSLFNFFSSYIYIYILGCRRCLVAPDTIVHRPWTCLFDCLVIDCDIGLNVVCGVNNRIDKLVRIRRAPL